MSTTFAGYSLLLPDAAGEFSRWLEWIGPESSLFAKEPAPGVRRRPRGSELAKVGLSTPNYANGPAIKPGSVWIPTGASRWSCGLFLVHSSQLALIRNVASSYSGGRLILAGDDSDHTVSLWMYPLTPRKLCESADGGSIYLLPLVDRRWFWQFVDVSALVLPDEYTWDQLITGLETLSGTTFSWVAADSSYLFPDPRELTRQYESFANILDAVAACVGCRVVYSPATDSTLLLSGIESAFFVNANMATDRLDRVMGGGNVSDLNTNETPRQVRVVFPWGENGEPSATGEVYSVTVDYSSVAGETPILQPTGTVHTVFDTALAEGSGVPDNVVELAALAARIASDYWAYLLLNYDYTFAGIQEWYLNGFDDWLLYEYGTHKQGNDSLTNPDHGNWRFLTRVTSQPPDFRVSELLHQGSFATDASSSSNETSSSSSTSTSSTSTSSSTSSSSSSTSLSSGDSSSSSSSSTSSSSSSVSTESSSSTSTSSSSSGLCVSMEDAFGAHLPFSGGIPAAVVGLDSNGCLKLFPVAEC